jgi:hypothetical protein
MSAHDPCARKPDPRLFRGDRRCDRIRASLQRPQTSPRFVGNDGVDRRQTSGAAPGAFRFRRHEAAAAERERADAAIVAPLAEGGRRRAPFSRHQPRGTRTLATVGDSDLRKRPCCNREALAAPQKMRLVVKSGSSRRGSPRSRSARVPASAEPSSTRRVFSAGGGGPSRLQPGGCSPGPNARLHYRSGWGNLAARNPQRGRRQMSRAIAVCHRGFGRATLYQINRPFNVHTHREGHLIFHVGGSDGSIDVVDRACPLRTAAFVAVSPWESRGS